MTFNIDGMVSICRDAWYYLGIVDTCGVVCEEHLKGVVVEGGFCYNLCQHLVSHEVNEPTGEFWLAFHAVPFPITTGKLNKLLDDQKCFLVCFLGVHIISIQQIV